MLDSLTLSSGTFWITVKFAIALLFTVIFSFIPERWLKPSSPRLNATSILLQTLLVTLLFFGVSLVVHRPIFAGLTVSIFLIILSGVSNAKFHALKEPLVFSDISMFSQAFKHPRLYFPFLGLIPVIVMPLVIIGLSYAVLMLEPAIAITWQRILTTLVAIVCYYFAAKNSAQDLSLSQNPASDNTEYGLLNSLFAYTIQARSSQHQAQIKNILQNSPFSLKLAEKTDRIDAVLDQATVINTQLPHELTYFEHSPNKTPPYFYEVSATHNLQNMTVIQSESFFDARRMHPSIHRNVLEQYDHCLKQSVQFGKLKVPAWGANTMRTEFSFLTGLKYEKMGLYRYYPYQYLQQMPIVSLAKLLHSQGYHCVCIHPHPASFFGRDRIFPQMGFDEFVDIQSFDTQQTFGPYISDQAVTDKILEVGRQHSDKPLFIFAITMENHGPLHLEKTTSDEQLHYYSQAPINQLSDLTVYLRHLKNADNMVAQLTAAYQQSDKAISLCFYGDHIPSMPTVYDALNYKDSDSDYFIWNNSKGANSPTEQHLSVDCLADRLLKTTQNL